MSAEASSRGRIRLAHWRGAVQALDAIWRGGAPADATLQAWFREHRQMGSRDRAHLATLVYGVLRDAMRLRRIAGDEPELLLAVHARSTALLDAATLQAFAGEAAARAAARLAAFDETTLGAAERANVPVEVWTAWCAQYGDEAPALAAALNREAPVDLRVNTLKATRGAAQVALAQAGIESVPTPLSAIGLRLAHRVALQASAPYREGWVEPQDEGSQLLAALVEAQPGERVVDFCAGAGGKTLALGAAMDDRGELWALDTSAARLARLPPRALRAGLDIVRPRRLPDVDWLTHHAARCDAVLVDAPCSGTGTWRRHPELRLRPLALEALARQQREILAEAARLLRPGGRLVYATCSLLAAENDEVIADFIGQHHDFVVETSDIAAAAGDPCCLRLLPHRHGTDGFFAVRLRRSL